MVFLGFRALGLDVFLGFTFRVLRFVWALEGGVQGLFSVSVSSALETQPSLCPGAYGALQKA